MIKDKIAISHAKVRSGRRSTFTKRSLRGHRLCLLPSGNAPSDKAKRNKKKWQRGIVIDFRVRIRCGEKRCAVTTENQWARPLFLGLIPFSLRHDYLSASVSKAVWFRIRNSRGQNRRILSSPGFSRLVPLLVISSSTYTSPSLVYSMSACVWPSINEPVIK